MFAICMTLLSMTAAEPARPPQFMLHSAGADPLAGVLKRIDKDGSITFEGENTKVSGSDVISLRRSDLKLPPLPGGAQIVFANGDRLAGDVVKIEKDQVTFRAALADGIPVKDRLSLNLPLSALVEIWFQSPPDPDAARRWAGERRRRDVVLLNNGDTRTGTVAGLAPAQPFLFKESTRETRIEAQQIQAVALNTDLARTLRPKTAYARLVLANGSRLSLLSYDADEKFLYGKTLFGADVLAQLDQIVAVDIRQGKAVYLSDLKPKDYEHTPFLGVRWHYELDRCVTGRELRLGGNAFDKGVGVHSACKLTYALNSAYRRFEALVGLDDRSGQGGSVRIRVVVDGKERDACGDTELTAATGPRVLRIDTSGAKEISLIVEFGAGGDVCDHVNWADARFIK